MESKEIHEIKLWERLACLLMVDMQLWRSEFSAFMRRAQMRYCSKLIVVPLSVFRRMAETIGDPRGELMFVINAGRSGSTLLMKVNKSTTINTFINFIR